MTKGSKGMKRKFIKMIGLIIMYMPQAFSENKILKDEESYIKLSKNEIIEKINYKLIVMLSQLPATTSTSSLETDLLFS